MAQKYIGIDLGSHHIKGVVVSAGLRGTQVIDVFEEPVGEPQAPDESEEEPPAGKGKVDRLAHAISVALHALRGRGLLGQTIALTLPPGLLSYRLLEFPFSDQRRIAQTVGFEADGQFPQPIEQLVHGHVVVPTTGGGGRALVVAANRERLERVGVLFKRAGTDVKVVTSPAIAAAQVSRAAPPAAPGVPDQGQPVTMLVDMGDAYTHFIAMGAKGPVAVRTLRRGGRQITRAIAAEYKLDREDAEAAKHADAFLPHRGFSDISSEQMDAGRLVAAAFEPILRELEHTRLWLRATYQFETTNLVLAGGGASLQGVAEYLSEQTGLPTEPFAPAAPGLKLMGSANWPSLAPALGAAYGAARRPLVQLQDDAGGESSSGWVQEKMSSLIAIGVAVLAFGALDSISQVRAAQAELEAHQDELDTATKAAFGHKLDPREVETTLARAEGADLTSLIPDRGALEVLAMITKASTPTDLGSAPPPGAATGPAGTVVGGAAGGTDPPGSTSPDEPDVEENEEGEDAKTAIGPIAADAGVVMVDNLRFGGVQIRERKIELKAEADTASAQDRLARELGKLGCLTKIGKGKVKGDERKTFEMTMDNTCYKQAEANVESEEEGDSDDGDEEEDD